MPSAPCFSVTRRDSFGLQALVTATTGALQACYAPKPQGPRSENHLTWLLQAGQQGLQLLQEHIKWMTAAGSQWPDDICDVLTTLTLDVLPVWLNQAAKSFRPVHIEIHSDGTWLAKQVVAALPGSWLQPERLIRGVSFWQKVTRTLADRQSVEYPRGLPGEPIKPQLSFAAQSIALLFSLCLLFTVATKCDNPEDGLFLCMLRLHGQLIPQIT